MAEVPNRTLQRGLDMLELLGAHAEGMALCELAQALRLPRSTAFNLAQTLTHLGYATQREDTGKYRLGFKMFEIGAGAMHQVDVMELIRSCMAEVHHTINETMHLGVRAERDTLYIDKLDSTQSIRMTSYVGARAPLYCTALGKAILSTMDDGEVRALYADEPLAALTPHSITSMDCLLEQLAAVREKGYAVEREENNENVCCVAVPLCNREGRAVYALSVSAPSFRMGEEEIARCAGLLLGIRPRIERFLKDAWFRFLQRCQAAAGPPHNIPYATQEQKEERPMEMIEKLSLAGIVPVIKVEDAADAVPLCKALSDGGLPVAEITFRSDAAEEAIRRVHAELPDVILGAGTVLTKDQVDRAVNAGATYIVSPGLNPEIVRYCQEKNVPIVPGCANPSDIEVALSLGLKTVKFFPAEPLGGLKLIKAMAAPYGGVTFLPTGGINEQNLNEYLAFSKIVACGGSWMVPGDAVAQKDWKRIEDITRSAVNKMLGLEIRHVGVNSGTPEQSMKDAQMLSKLLGWPIDEHKNANFVGEGFEVMKVPFRGTHGHIAVACNSIKRARWHMERRGFAFDDSSVIMKDGKMRAIYLKDEIAGFAVHLLQK